jgi:protein-S-isoprenylcysteine O-methyltransferase Ste14
MNEPRSSWWRGTQGEWYVVVQIALVLLVVAGPRTLLGLPAWISPFDQAAMIAGLPVFLIGSLLAFAGIVRLGANLTVVPHPKENSQLVQTGPYKFVRHPIYSGVILAAFGWALLIHGWLTILYAIALLVFFDIKSRREERWLGEKFPEYHSYQKRVRKLVPWIY